MSATARAKSKAKPRSAPKTREERAEISRQNSKRSTGPRTEEGKRKSKYNAVTHGLTARTVLLPGEDAAALAARQQHLVDSFQPRNAVELAVIEGMAGEMWKSQRADLAAGLRISARLRHESLEQEKKERDESLELGGRLFRQPSFPLPISRRFQMGSWTNRRVPRTPSIPIIPPGSSCGSSRPYRAVTGSSILGAIGCSGYMVMSFGFPAIPSRWSGSWASTPSTWSTISPWRGCSSVA